MSPTPPDARPDAGSSEEASADEYPAADPGIELYEDGEQVGVIDLDAETYEYDGGYEAIAELLETVADEGWHIWAARTTRVTGVGLGRELLRRLHERTATDLSADADLELAAIGFEPEHKGVLDGSAFERTNDVMGELAQRRAERDSDTESTSSETQN